MPYMDSSPVAYPAGSPPALDPPRKRKRDYEEGRRSPLQEVQPNATRRNLGPFVEDDSDDELEDDHLIKHRVFQKPPPVTGDESENAEEISGAVAGPLSPPFEPNAQDSTRNRPAETNAADLSFINPGAPLTIKSSSGRKFYVGVRRTAPTVSYEQVIASRSTTLAGRAQRCYYGLDIHQLMDDAAQETVIAGSRAQAHAEYLAQPSMKPQTTDKKGRTLMWTEKYRARKFTDLVGDDRTHRSVLRWLKAWDEIVFPGSARMKPRRKDFNRDQIEERTHRKILLLTGPPGLGKTTLAHVCARQAGYEVQEINASDERSKDVVRGRIRDMVGTENVKTTASKAADGSTRKTGRPVCVVVDEVDGVVGGNSGAGGEGGFVKALIDLINLDQRNSQIVGGQGDSTSKKKQKRGDKFRMLRPLILICNDVYHPSLRPLRQSSLAEIVHMRKPPLSVVALRMQSIFEREGVPCDGDGVRRLCEATWGVSNHKEGGSGSGTVEGDIRSIMVVAEWVAGRLRASRDPNIRLTRQWFEEHVLNDLAHGGGAARSLGRGGAREVVERVFVEGAGFPKTQMAVKKNAAGHDRTASIGVAEAQKSRAFERLRQMVETSGDVDRIVTDVFTKFPSHPYQDDTFLSKPNACHEWLHFHDTLSSQLYSSQDWELAPYLSQSTLAFHHLFATSSTRQQLYSHSGQNNRNGYKQYQNKDSAVEEDDQSNQTPFTGPTAPFQASEATKANAASIASFQSSLSLRLTRMYRSQDAIATELLPYVLRILNPDVKPVIINLGSRTSSGGSGPTSTASVRKASEKELVAGAVEAMIATGVKFERARVDMEGFGARPGQGGGGWVFRMEPPIDVLGTFETRVGRDKSGEGVRYAVRQVLDAEYRREMKKREGEARARRGGFEPGDVQDHGEAEEEAGKKLLEAKKPKVKKDFFGRTVAAPEAGAVADSRSGGKGQEGRIWCSFHEGINKAVRKPISLDELMRGV